MSSLAAGALQATDPAADSRRVEAALARLGGIYYRTAVLRIPRNIPEVAVRRVDTPLHVSVDTNARTSVFEARSTG